MKSLISSLPKFLWSSGVLLLFLHWFMVACRLLSGFMEFHACSKAVDQSPLFFWRLKHSLWVNLWLLDLFHHGIRERIHASLTLDACSGLDLVISKALLLLVFVLYLRFYSVWLNLHLELKDQPWISRMSCVYILLIILEWCLSLSHSMVKDMVLGKGQWNWL